MKLTLLLAVLLTLGRPCLAATYHVGKGQAYETVQALLEKVTPGDNDVILLHPGTYPAFRVEKGGGRTPETAPVLRAYDMADRPIIDAAGKDNAVTFQHPTGTWWAIDGLEIKNASFRGVFNVECGLVMRHCYLHDCRNGLMGGMNNARNTSPGYLIAEYNEFARNGNGAYAHQLYVEERWTVFRYNWIHDNTGGQAYKDRSRESRLEYNWIEQGPGGNYTVEFCGCGDAAPDHTQTATMVGNVVLKKGGGNTWLFVVNTRGEGGDEKALNVGHLTLVNNTFYSEDHTGPMLGTDQGSVIAAYNNVFQSTTSTALLLPVSDATGPGAVLPSHNNWVNARQSISAEFGDTLRGSDPGFVRAAFGGGDFHLRADSPCREAGSDLAYATPGLQYLSPHAWTFRPRQGRVDIGAFEYVPDASAKGAKAPEGEGVQ